MSKYVIELDKEQLLEYDKDTDTYFRTLYKAKGFNSLVFDKHGLDKLTPLDKELKEAYQKGVHDGSIDVKERVDGDYQKGYEAGQHEATTLEYQQGLDDAWECARRLVWETSLNEAEHMGFIAKEESAEILRDYTVTAAMKAVELYDKKLEAEIKVGDEVCFVFAGGETIEPFIVFSIKDDNGKKYYEGIQVSDGRWVGGGLKYYKTGRHFQQVAELLEAMKGEQRNCSKCEHDGDQRFCDPCRHNDMWQPKEVTE